MSKIDDMIKKLCPNGVEYKPLGDVAEQDYNLSVSTYVEQKDDREKVDIVKLNKDLEEIVKKENELRKAIDKIVADLER